MQICILLSRSSPSPLQRFDRLPHHGALALVEMPALQVQRDDKGNQIVAEISFKPRFDTGDLAGAMSFATIDDPTVGQLDDRLTQPVLGDVVCEFLQFGIRHQRKYPGYWMKYLFSHCTTPRNQLTAARRCCGSSQTSSISALSTPAPSHCGGGAAANGVNPKCSSTAAGALQPGSTGGGPHCASHWPLSR
jgi:hypothetical protein